MPIDIAFGSVTLDAEDLSVPGKLALVWDRHYGTPLIGRKAGMLGIGWTNRYSATLTFRDERFEFTTPSGGIEHFADAHGIVANGGVVQHLGAFLEVFRDDAHCIVRSWNVDSGEVVRYRFAPGPPGEPWPLLAIEDNSGHALLCRRDAVGRLVAVDQMAEGRSLLLNHDPSGRVETVELIGASGERHVVARLAYDTAGRLVSVIDAAGYSEEYAYDGAGRLTREVTKNGGVFHYRYDERGRCVQRSGLDRYSMKRLRYLDGTRTTEVTDSYDRKFIYHYLPSGQTLTEIDPLGARRTTAYDEHARIVAKTDATGATTQYGFDERGNRSLIVDALGAPTAMEYDKDHRLLALTDAKRQRWERVYDASGRVAFGIEPSGARWSFLYDASGQLAEVENPIGARRQYLWQHGMLVALTDWQRGETHLRFDDFGRLVERHGPRGDALHLTYDAVGNLVRAVLPDGGRLAATYDAVGNVTHFVDADGRSTRWRYGSCGRLMERTDKAGRTVRYLWGTERNRLEQVINEKGEAYRFFRDDNWNITREQGFDGAERRFVSDPEGHTIAFTNPLGEQVLFERDALHRVIHQTLPDGSSVHFNFDDLGWVAGATNGASTLRFERDAHGRIVSETSEAGWVRNRFDASGGHTGTESSKGLSLDFELDPNGFVRALSMDGTAKMAFKRNAYGQEVERCFGADTRMEQRFDVCGRLTDQQLVAPGHGTPSGRSVMPAAHGDVLRRSFHYDAAGQLVRVDDGRRGWFEFAYDAGEQLVAALRERGNSEAFEYDECGNLTRILAEGPQTKDDRLAYGPGNRLLRKGSTLYTYDAAGRRTAVVERADTDSPATWRYEWNALDRLTAVVRPDGERWEYTYDALGRRIAKTGPRERRTYLWDRDVVLHESIDGRCAASWVYHGTGFTPLVTLQSGQLLSVVADHLGTPRELVDERGHVAWTVDLTAFGGEQPETRAAARGADCPIRFAGQWHDAETGLHYNRHRYFDPACGAYISEDPLRLAAGLHLYAYGRNPVNSADPLGLNPEYYPKDDQKRPTGGFAEVNQSNLGTGTDAKVNPPGWVSGEHPDHQQRSHLIAANHGGSGTDDRNIVALTSGSNHPGMRTQEDKITAHVNKGNTVLVEVKAHYVGDSKVPDHVTMYAIDQNGKVIVDEKIANGRLQNHKACGCS
jgi:RHS repeat-associated protein